MNKLILVPVTEQEKLLFIKQIQEAFQVGYESEYGPCDDIILPKKDIEQAFTAKGAEAYFALVSGGIVGGAVITVNNKTKNNHLDLLYVKVGCQNKGTGQAIWKAIEELHPETEVWETHTPYFEKRNIHFYVNKLGFHIVEFYNQHNKDSHQNGEPAGEMPEEGGYDFFRFEKMIK